jgi:protoporphyrinogen oxidase
MEIGIIGGGTMGLTLAYRLSQSGHRVTVLEASPQLGGLATWFDYGDFTWDKFYHVICRSDSDLLGLISELGLSPHLNWSSTKTGFLWRGRLVSMSNHVEFLRFPALSLLDKLRLAAGIVYCYRLRNTQPLEGIKARNWLTKVFGPRIYQTIWEPLVESKYGVLKDDIPATTMWATIRRYYSTRTKSAASEQFGFLTGGLRSFFTALADSITTHQGKIYCSHPVEFIDDSNPAKVVLRARRQHFEFDRVISTLPTATLGTIAPGVQGLSLDHGVKPQCLDVICLALVLRRPLTPYYITNLIDKGFPFTGIIEVSNMTGTEPLGGRHLALLPRYDIARGPWFTRAPAEIAGDFLSALKPICRDIDRNIVRWFVHRAPCVQAVWLSRPPSLDQAPMSWDKRVWSVNSELAGDDTQNNNAVVRVANQFGREFLKSVAAEPAVSTRSTELRPNQANVGLAWQ